MSKTKVANYWIENFVGLSKFTTIKLYSIIGPFVCGIEIIALPRIKKYRPHFVLYPLYRTTIKECLLYPDLMFPIENVIGPGKHNQYNLEYETESESAKSAVIDARKQIGLEFNSEVRLIQVNNLFDKQISKGVRVSSLLEAKYMLNLVIGENCAKEVFEEINQSQENLVKGKSIKFQTNFIDLLSNLKKINREELLRNVDKNSSDGMLLKLGRKELKNSL
jgi:hypothetical protein